jgi:type II secretory pathway component GspD/PulD (secretin)
VELPNELIGRYGLDDLIADGQTSAGSGILTAEQTQRAIRDFEKTDGVDILAAPQVVTLSGRQAQVSVTQSHPLPSGQTYTTGPVIDVTPTIAADRQTVEFVVGAQLNLPREPK